LEDITQQLLEGKHTITLNQLFKLILDLRQYVVVKLAPGRIIVIMLGFNSVITLVAIDLHMVVVHVQVARI
jgi:hypothetical protein